MPAGPPRRDVGETIRAALLYVDMRGFTALSEAEPPAAVITHSPEHEEIKPNG